MLTVCLHTKLVCPLRLDVFVFLFLHIDGRAAQGPPTPAGYRTLLTANLDLLASPTREVLPCTQTHLSPCAHLPLCQAGAAVAWKTPASLEARNSHISVQQ